MSYDGLIPVPPHLWHLTILSPFLRVPLPSQFLHGFFFSPALFFTLSSLLKTPEVASNTRRLRRLGAYFSMAGFLGRPDSRSPRSTSSRIQFLHRPGNDSVGG